jgi:predicted RNA polymerase sigma factor
MMAADIHRTIQAVWRIEQPRLLTSLARMLRDVPLAEDLTQEALVAALEHWPTSGVPEQPGAWLMATAKRRALDQLRRTKMLARSTRWSRATLSRSKGPCPIWMHRSTTISATKCCG